MITAVVVGVIAVVLLLASSYSKPEKTDPSKEQHR